MPALWPTFIPALTSDLAGQSFTKPGGAMISYDLPKVGKDQVPIFPPSAELVESLKPGNPANAALVTDPTAMVNAINLAPLSGRYDFGVNVAERYLEAVKGLAMTPFGATHKNTPAAELLLKQGYGLIFERMLKEGDIPMLDQKDEDGNITELGKESHPDYADFCPEPIEEPDPIEEQKKLDKKLNKFLVEYKDDTYTDLKKFKFFEFHCLDGTESQSVFITLIVNRLLQQFETIDNTDKLEFAKWATSLGNENYQSLGYVDQGAGGTTFNTLWPYPNVNTLARTNLELVNYNWREVVNGVSAEFKSAIYAAFALEEDAEDTLENRINAGQTIDIVKPWPHDTEEIPECPLFLNKIQISYDRETDSTRPVVLNDAVIALFSYDDISAVAKSFLSTSSYSIQNGAYVYDQIKWWKKTTTYTDLYYVDLEYELNWIKIPGAMDTIRSVENFVALDPKIGGTIFKFQRQYTIDAIAAAELCDANEPDPEIDYVWPGGDPYLEMAQITIAYWYACLIQPFAASPSAMPAMIPPPLTGIYIPIYYGGAKRLAGNLRKAWNTGKTFSVIPAPQPPSLAVSTAVAAAYMIHLLEFKLLYLGGIPTPAGPMPMIGIVPVVF